MNKSAIQSRANPADEKCKEWCWFTALNAYLATFSGYIIIIMVCLIFSGITLRYFFDTIFVWIDEIISSSIPLLVMVSISSLITQNKHISVDIMSASLSGLPRKIVDVLGSLSELLVAVLIFLSGISMVFFSLRYNIQSPSELGVHDWVYQLSLPLGGVFMMLACVSKVIRRQQK